MIHWRFVDRLDSGRAGTMVVGERFAWGHIPKTGGTATRALFRLFPHLILSADPDDTNAKHDPFPEREALVQGKLLALNLRRLPAWILSRAHHNNRHGIYPEYRPLPMPSPEAMTAVVIPDERIEAFTDNGRLNIDRWLRMESLAADFLDFVAEFTDVSAEQRVRALELGRLNANEYDHQVDRLFSEDQLRRMYRNNPRWSALEKALYGNLLTGE